MSSKRKLSWKLPKELSSQELKQLQKLHTGISANFPGISELAVQFLWNRGIREAKQALELLSSDAERLFKSAETLPGALVAAAKIITAMEAGKQIFIYGDYDVDGVCATAILWRFLYWELGYKLVKPIIPNRYSEGYGINEVRLKAELAEVEEGQEVLLITVDCGIKDAELLSSIAAANGKLEVIITDHHLPPDFSADKPLAAADVVQPGQLLVHPRLTGLFPWPEICAAAISWMLTGEIRGQLKDSMASIDDQSIEGSRLESLELAALATVCDQMPLLGINRDIVKIGLAQMGKSNNQGLKALAQVAGIDLSKVGVYELGYVLGPRINAAGRMEDATIALKLLCTRSQEAAAELANNLELLNRERQDHTKAALSEMATIAADASVAILTNPDWKEGIVGLIAGKLQEATGLPSLVATQNHQGDWVGSARSSGQVNITELIASQQHLLVKFGGHAQAAGFTLLDKNLAAFKEGIASQAVKLQPSNFTLERQIDLVITPETVSIAEIDSLKLLEPFGQEFEPPKMLLKQIILGSYREFGQENRHLSAKQQTPTGSYELIWFNHDLELKNINEKQHSFVGSLGYNEWRGQITPQFKITALYLDEEN